MDNEALYRLYVNAQLDQRDNLEEQNRLLMCIGTALEKIADTLDAIEMSVRKN